MVKSPAKQKPTQRTRRGERPGKGGHKMLMSQRRLREFSVDGQVEFRACCPVCGRNLLGEKLVRMWYVEPQYSKTFFETESGHVLVYNTVDLRRIVHPE